MAEAKTARPPWHVVCRMVIRDRWMGWLYWDTSAADWHAWFAWKAVYVPDLEQHVRWRWVKRRLNCVQEDYWWEYSGLADAGH